MALVTGAGTAGGVPGIGEAIAILMASQGAKVGLLDISRDLAENTQREIARIGGESTVLVGDVTSADDAERCATELVEAYGHIDILVNSAAITGGGGTPTSVDLDDFRKVIEIDLTSVAVVGKHVIPHLQAAGGGAIINISSVAAMRGFGSSAYAAAKAGMMGLTTEWAFHLGNDNIRVNCIAIGHAYTPMGGAGISAHMRDIRLAAGMLNHEGDAWDVAWPVLFLASEEGRWITGTTIPIDGGATALTYLGGMNLNARRQQT